MGTLNGWILKQYPTNCMDIHHVLYVQKLNTIPKTQFANNVFNFTRVEHTEPLNIK